MRWHGFSLERGLSAPYWGMPRAVVGAHQLLLIASAAAENSGCWEGARAWCDREWIRFTGLELAEIGELVAHGLVVWLTPEEAAALVVGLTPSSVELERPRGLNEPPVDWERCRITAEAICHFAPGVAPLTQHIDRSTHLVDRSTHLVDRSTACVVDYDLGGQVLSRHMSESASKLARLRWGPPRQLSLPNPTHLVDRSTHLVDRGLNDATALHSYRDRSEIPPLPPLSGGRSVPAVSGEDEHELERFWAWLLGARPLGLSSALWGGGKAQVMLAIVRKAHERGASVATLLGQIQGDLERKFRTPRWVSDWGLAGRGLRSYVKQDDFLSPEPTTRAKTPVDVELERRRAAAELERHELELRKTWAEEMPGRPFPPTVDEADRLLREKHGWTN
jgi:hypothetical protein